MESLNRQSNLKTLILTLIQPLKENPEALLERSIPEDKKKLYMTIRGLMCSPIMPEPIRNFNPSMLVGGLVERLESAPDSFFIELENLLLDVIAGEPGAIERVQSLLGGTPDAHTNQAG